MTDREEHIKNLSYIMDSMPDDVCGDWRDSLAYAISSLKTDEAYQLMYEGGKIFTVDEVIAMLADIKSKIKDVYVSDNGERFIRMTCRDYVQEKINALRGEEE